MKTPKRSVVNGHICNQQESSSLTMAPTISKVKTPVKIKKEKSQKQNNTRMEGVVPCDLQVAPKNRGEAVLRVLL